MTDAMTAAMTAAPARTFRVTVPPKWWRLDVDRQTMGESIPRLVTERVGADPRIAAARSEFTGLLLGAAEQAAANGAVFAAMYAEQLDGGLLGASMLAFVTALDEAATRDGRADLDRLHDLVLRTANPGDEVVESGTVVLPAGAAVRLRRRTRGRVMGRDVSSEVVQYFVPVPGRRNTVVMTFSTPTVQLGDAFAALFAAMADSLQWVR
jgi:hypothetical protein